jgi:hypothetical protein
MENEIWKDIAGYEGYYQVSNLGRVRSYPRNGTSYFIKILKARIDMGYERVWLSRGNMVKPQKISRLVASVFIPNINNKPEVNHINGVKTDNRVENLEWVTKSENIKHAFATGLANPVKYQCHTKLNDAIVNEVRKLCKTGIRQVQIAKMFNISPQKVSAIKLGKVWKQN